jgi:hypothetical protein
MKNKQRILLVLGIVTYLACFQWMYIHWLYPLFGYYGFDFNPPAPEYVALAWILSVLPSLWMPLVLARPSQLIYWVLYSTAFIPSMFVPLYAGMNKPSEVAGLMLTLFAGLVISGFCYLFPLLKLRPRQLRKSQFWYGFAVLSGGLALWVMVAFRGRLQILSFMDIYDLRFAADDIMAGTRLNYALMWLSGAIDPFLMGWGLYYKKPYLFLLGTLGQVLVYTSLGTKGSFVSIFFMLAIYLLLQGKRVPFALKLTWGLVALFVGLSVSSVVIESEQSSLFGIVLFVVFMRTFAMNGLMTAWYYDFFQRNPQTHFSHIAGVSWVLHYPYANTVGIEVGSFYLGDPTVDANGHLWATDGLAAFGLPGILLISVFCAFVFWALDSVAEKHDPRLTALLVSYAAYNLANIGIFTSLLSGGLALLMVILYLMPPENSADSVNRKANVRVTAARGVMA